MPTDVQLSLNPTTESNAQRSLWFPLASWLSPAAAGPEAVLGYESALPWTLGLNGPVDSVDLPY